MSLDEWINATLEGTEDPYLLLERDGEDRELVDSLVGGRW